MSMFMYRGPPITTVPPPTVAGSFVALSGAIGGTNDGYAGSYLYAPWKREIPGSVAGGDYRDSFGVLNGTHLNVSVTVLNPTTTVNIAALQGDILIRNIDDWRNPKIDGVAATAFWTSYTAQSALPMPMNGGRQQTAGFVLNPNLGTTLTFDTIASQGQTAYIDKVEPQFIHSLPMKNVQTTTPDLLNLELTDYNTIYNRTGIGGGQHGFAVNGNDPSFIGWNPQYLTDPVTGLQYFRFSSDPLMNNQVLIDWWFPFTPQTEMYTRYLFYIESDVGPAFNELGMKLPGPGNIIESAGQNPSQPDILFYRMEHGQPAPGNTDLYGFVGYFIDRDTSAGPCVWGSGCIPKMGGVTFRANRWYCIEQYFKLCTPSVSNGLFKCWVNGNLVQTYTTRMNRFSASSTLTMFDCNFYHGGLQKPIGLMHYRTAKLACSTTRIGVPRELMGPGFYSGSPYPAWRIGLVKDTVYQIGNVGTNNTGTLQTANMNNAWQGSHVMEANDPPTCAANIINTWNGFATGPRQWWSALSNGHGNVSGEGFCNGVYVFDFSANVPQWVMLDPGTARANLSLTSAYMNDTDGVYAGRSGRPVARHTYGTTQYLASKNRIFTFSVNAGYATQLPPGSPPNFASGLQVDAFNLANNTWDVSGTWLNAPALGLGIVVARNTETDDVYMARTNPFGKFNAQTNQWEIVYPLLSDGITGVADPGDWKYRPQLIDVGRNRWMRIGSQITPGEDAQVQAIDMTTYIMTTYAMSGALFQAPYPGRICEDTCVVHDLDNDRYITVQPILPDQTSAGMFAIDPETWVTTLIAVVGYVNGPVNVNGNQGIQNRLAYFAELGGVAYLPQYSSNVLFNPTR